MNRMTTSKPAPEASAPPASHVGSEKAVIARASLSLLLLNLADIVDSEDGFDALFREIGDLIPFDGVVAVERSHDGLRCVAAQPPDFVGWTWDDQAAGDLSKVWAVGKAADSDERARLCGIVDDGRPALCLPLTTGSRTVTLLLSRSHEAEDFDESSLAMGRFVSVLSLASLSLANGARLESEIDQLKGRIAASNEALRAEHDARSVLDTVVDQLPIGLTVQDEDGSFIIVNGTAAEQIGAKADSLVGTSPATFLSEEEAASRQEWERRLLEGGQRVTAETNSVDHEGERTWLTTYQPARSVDRPLLITTAVDVSKYKAVERDLVESSFIDQLTGLPDRRRIQDFIGAIVADQDASRRFALAFIDLDNFKQINDYYSHTIGDNLLRQVSQRISSTLRPSSILARISGDEFLLLLDAVESEEQVGTIINEILRVLKQPFLLEGYEIFASCSIGVSVYPQHGRTYETLRRNADSAMYRAKHSAKGSAVLFDSSMAQAVTARMEVEQRLRLAIRDHKFCCAFQPKVDIYTHETVGLEALVRYVDDDGEIHSPGDFVGLAVELGLINPITIFVLDEVLSSLDRLDAAFGSDTTVSINVAAKQAGDLEFMQSLAQRLKESNRAERIVIEVTEEAFVAKGTFQTQVIPLLRDIGVRVSIDDFGAGYSSLGVLADISADEVKIDRSFITGIHERPRNQMVLRAIESLCHALGMSIVAEGAETYEEVAYLQAATRIRCVQGFYFSKPFYLEDLSGKTDAAIRTREAARATNEPQRAQHGRSAELARARAEREPSWDGDGSPAEVEGYPNLVAL